MLEKLSKMSAREAMITLAGRPPMHGELPRWLEHVARKVGITFRTARSLWLGEINDPEHWAAAKVRREAEVAEARKELAALANKFTSIAGGMRVQDEDFYSPQIDRLERLVRIIGALDSPGTKGAGR